MRPSLEVLRGYGSEHDVAAGDVLFADGDETNGLIVLLAGTADIIEGYGHPGASVVASYGPSEFLGEIGMLTGQRAFLSAFATSAGRILAVPVAQLRRVMAREPGLSDLILRTFLLRHSILMSRGTGLTLIGSRFDRDTRRLLEVLAAPPDAGGHERNSTRRRRAPAGGREPDARARSWRLAGA